MKITTSIVLAKLYSVTKKLKDNGKSYLIKNLYKEIDIKTEKLNYTNFEIYNLIDEYDF